MAVIGSVCFGLAWDSSLAAFSPEETGPLEVPLARCKSPGACSDWVAVPSKIRGCHGRCWSLEGGEALLAIAVVLADGVCKNDGLLSGSDVRD